MKPRLTRILLLLLLMTTGLSDDTYLDASCLNGGECTALRSRFASLVSGTECWRIHETGVCNLVCLKSLRALQGRRAWIGCARRCSWPPAIVDGARDWTAWCESRAEPEEQPSINETVLNTTDRVPDSGGGEKLKGGSDSGIFGVVAAVVLAVLGVVAGLAIVLTKPSVRNRAMGALGTSHSKSGPVGILGRAPDRSEMRRLAHGARRHLKAIRSNVD